MLGCNRGVKPEPLPLAAKCQKGGHKGCRYWRVGQSRRLSSEIDFPSPQYIAVKRVLNRAGRENELRSCKACERKQRVVGLKMAALKSRRPQVQNLRPEKGVPTF